MSGDQSWSYKWIEDAANSIASSFVDEGVAKGDRIAIVLDNSIETVVSVFGALKVGAIFLVLSPKTKEDRLISILSDAAAAVVVADERVFRTVVNHHTNLPELKLGYVNKLNATEPSEQSYRCILFSESIRGVKRENYFDDLALSETDPAALIYTSGSTGESKGVLLSHRNIVFSTGCIIRYLENKGDDVILNLLPFSHSYGLTQLMTSFQVGATLVLADMFGNPRGIASLIASARITGFAMTPTIAATLGELDFDSLDISCLRYITNAADALSIAAIRRIQRTFPGAQLFLMYGLTECMRASFLPPDQLAIRPTSIGRGLPGQRLEIVDEEGALLGPGLVGELVVEGPNVMLGYWRRQNDSDKVLKAGVKQDERRLHTGDYFKMDSDGYYHFVARKGEIIKTCGEKVAPLEIEEVLRALAGIEEAAVVGVPDEMFGQAVKAVIRVRNGVSVSRGEIIAHCRKHLEHFKVPTWIEFSSTIPRTAGGKIERYKLATVPSQAHD